MKSTSLWPSMYNVPPVLGLPEPGLMAWVPELRDVEPPVLLVPPPLPDDDEPPHAATTAARATTHTPGVNALKLFRIDTLLSLKRAAPVRLSTGLDDRGPIGPRA